MTFTLKSPAVPRLSENDVERQITDFLRLRGWHVERMQSGMFQPWWPNKPTDNPRPIRVGRKGMVDWLAVQPHLHKVGKPCVLFIEVKAPGKKPNPHQMKELRERVAQGFLAGWFDSLKGFERFYVQHVEGKVVEPEEKF
jgi:hypothetical protein